MAHMGIIDPLDPPTGGQFWPWYWQLEKYVHMADTTNGYGHVMPAKGVFLCPGYAKAARVDYDVWNEGAYGYNGAGTARDGSQTNSRNFGLGGELIGPAGFAFSYRPIKESEVFSPSRMFALGDAMFGGGRVLDTSNLDQYLYGLDWLEAAIGAFDVPPSNDSIEALNRTINKRHSGRWVVGFCDAHIETLNTKKFTDYNDPEVLRHWNRDDQAHREALALP